MALHFVSTSVLTSDNGIGYSKEEKKETEEVKKARLQAERINSRSLYEQLAEQERLKQAEFDANTKLIFAPTKALDDEEATFLDHITEAKIRAEKERKQKEELEIRLFKEKSRNPRQEVQPTDLTTFGAYGGEKKMSIRKEIKVVPKRKISITQTDESNAECGKAPESKLQKKAPESSPLDQTDSKDATITLLADYGSDSD